MCVHVLNVFDIVHVHVYYIRLFPLFRLDAGTFGTMGVGTGFAIAAALYNMSLNKSKKQVNIMNYIMCKVKPVLLSM